MEDTTAIFAIVGVLVSAAGIFGGFVYNARSIRQNTRTRYYQIQKDIENEFHEIEMLSSKDLITHHMRIFNFAISLIQLINRKMIPEEYIFPNHTMDFSFALWVQSNKLLNFDDAGAQEDIKILKQFCKKNKILSIEPALKKKIERNSQKES